VETVERQGIFGIFARTLGPDDGGFGRQSRRRKDGRDRRDLSEGASGASHSDRFGRQKGARGRPTRSSPPLRSAIALEHGH